MSDDSIAKFSGNVDLSFEQFGCWIRFQFVNWNKHIPINTFAKNPFSCKRGRWDREILKRKRVFWQRSLGLAKVLPMAQNKFFSVLSVRFGVCGY